MIVSGGYRYRFVSIEVGEKIMDNKVMISVGSLCSRGIIWIMARAGVAQSCAHSVDLIFDEPLREPGPSSLVANNITKGVFRDVRPGKSITAFRFYQNGRRRRNFLMGLGQNSAPTLFIQEPWKVERRQWNPWPPCWAPFFVKRNLWAFSRRPPFCHFLRFFAFQSSNLNQFTFKYLNQYVLIISMIWFMLTW